MELERITEVDTTTDVSHLNRLLKSGWVLLQVGVTGDDVFRDMTYVVGKQLSSD